VDTSWPLWVTRLGWRNEGRYGIESLPLEGFAVKLALPDVSRSRRGQREECDPSLLASLAVGAISPDLPSRARGMNRCWTTEKFESN